MQDSFAGRARADVEPRRCAGTTTASSARRRTASACFDPRAAGPVDAGRPAVRRDFNNFAPAADPSPGTSTGDGKTVVRAGWGLYFDALLAGLLRRPAALEHLQPRSGLQRRGPSRSRSASRPSARSRGAAGLRPDVLGVRRLHGRSRARHAVRAQLQRERPAPARRQAALQVGYVGSAGRQLFRYRDINQVDPRTGARPFDNGPFAPTAAPSSTSTSSRSTATSRATTGCRRACAVRRLARPDLDAQLHLVALDRQRQRRPGLRAERVAARRQLQPGERARQLELRRAPSASRGIFTYDLPAPTGAGVATQGWSVDGVAHAARAACRST